MNFTHELMAWHQAHPVDLPWNNTQDPYPIWVSEVILQQTRVAQGTAYYYRFLEAFPTVAALACAPLDEVMRLWQGLGYYSRARNMHTAAQQVVQEHGGIFPHTYEGLRSLRGVGEYTAAAIAAFAFNLPEVAVDGNFYRVLSRYFGIDTPIDSLAGQKQLKALAHQVLDTAQARQFNQAMMNFGRTQCTPKSPNCAQCSLASGCVAWHQAMVDTLPIKSRKTKQRKRYLHYLVVEAAQHTLIRKRTSDDIWHSLYEFPLIETTSEVDLATLEHTPQWIQWLGTVPVSITRVSPLIKHVLSHQLLFARFYHIALEHMPPQLLQEYATVPSHSLDTYSMPGLIVKYLDTLHH